MSAGKIKLAHADAIWMLCAKPCAGRHYERKAGCDANSAVAQSLGGQILPDEELTDINTNLVEYPIAVAGKFDQEFLEVPDAVLITAMREHQKYFSVVDRRQIDAVFYFCQQHGCQRHGLGGQGARASHSGATGRCQFFFRGPEVSNDNGLRLKGVLFQAQLGSMFEKAQRVGEIATYLAVLLGLSRCAAPGRLAATGASRPAVQI